MKAVLHGHEHERNRGGHAADDAHADHEEIREQEETAAVGKVISAVRTNVVPRVTDGINTIS